MDLNDFEKKYVRTSELRKLFPYWTDATFRKNACLGHFPFPVTKVAGRLYCAIADVEEYKKKMESL